MSDKKIIPQNGLKFNGYKRDEPIEGHYLRLPKDLFNGPYRELSIGAKLLYAILLDRTELSRKNDWTDKNGEIYIICEREEVQAALNVGKNKPTQLFNELKRFGLIKEKSQGMNKAKIIFVGKITPFSSLTPENEESRLPEIGNPDSLKQGRNKPYINKPDINKPDLKDKRDFSGKPKKSSLPSLKDESNYSEWNRIMAVKFPNSIVEYTLKRFIWEYKRNMEQDHPSLENQQLERCFKVLGCFYIDNDIDNESDMDVMIAKYFKTNFPNANYGNGCDYRFNHFATEGVLQNRFWEELY